MGYLTTPCFTDGGLAVAVGAGRSVTWLSVQDGRVLGVIAAPAEVTTLVTVGARVLAATKAGVHWIVADR